MDNSYLIANIKGDISSSNLNGIAYFYSFKDGVMVEIELKDLPGYKPYELFSVSIYDGINCDISKEGTFKDNIKEYNPTKEKYPYMVGDMPVLFSNSGYAYLKFYTTRFKIYDIVGKLVVVNMLNKKDNTIIKTKIGCGVITSG